MSQKQRKIIHIDMDAFFAAVAQLDNPELQGKPVVVASPKPRGVISAASYEARKFGVRSAMSSQVAKKLCPELIFVPSDFLRYKLLSNQIRGIFKEYTDLIEPLSFDEAFLDVTENKKKRLSATLIARDIRAQIYKETGLTASAGISSNKFIAKIASDYNKPNGQKTVIPTEIADFVAALPIHKFFGIGKVTAAKMLNLGIFTGKELREQSLEFLEKHFGNSAQHYYNLARGIDTSEVKPSRTTKSVATEHTFETNLTSEIYMEEALKKITNSLVKRLKKAKLKGKTITLKIKYSDFSVQTRSKSIAYFTDEESMIFSVVKSLLYQEKPKESVRLLGISLSKLDNIKNNKSVSIQLKFDF